MLTRHAKSEHAFCLSYDRNGVLQTKVVCAREPGTTVVVKNIFKSLPVRAKEFHKNIKKEFAKMINVLYGYCLVSTGVKITCTSSVSGKSSNVVVSTTGAKSVLENVSSTFGNRSLAGVEEVELQPPDESTLQEFRLPGDLKIDFLWEFYVSSCDHTMGRSTPDRQFFYVNGRPCHLTKISKLVNNIYHKYNGKQYPFVFLNLKPDQHCADVNVTPDKRTIFLTQEKFILATVKSNLVRKWDKMQGSFSTKTLEELNYSLKRSISSGNASPDPPAKKLLLSKKADRSLSETKDSENDGDDDDGERCLQDDETIEKLKDRDLNISLESVKRELLRRTSESRIVEREAQRVKYRVLIEPSKSSEAEKELQKELTKESFRKVPEPNNCTINLSFLLQI